MATYPLADILLAIPGFRGTPSDIFGAWPSQLYGMGGAFLDKWNGTGNFFEGIKEMFPAFIKNPLDFANWIT